MRQITPDEQLAILKELSRSRFWADMMVSDAICYGGDLIGYRDQREYARRVIEAFPKDVLEEYRIELRREKANELRAQAEAIERGEK